MVRIAKAGLKNEATKGELYMKRLVSLIVTLTMLFVIYVDPIAANNVSQNPVPKETSTDIQTWEETSVDELGNILRIETTVIGDEVTTVVYLNEVLTQKAFISPESNTIIYEEYSEAANTTNAKVTSTPSVSHYEYSDFVVDIEPITSEDTQMNTLLSWDPEGWAYYGYFAPAPNLVGAKPTNLYFRNYDEEPDLLKNRFNQKHITLGQGTPVSIAVGLVTTFVTWSFSALTIISMIGGAIVGDIITNALSNTLSFSTQKIMYAPIINGVNVFPDAHITKRWFIDYNALTAKEKLYLWDETYLANRGTTPAQIAINAQIATLN